MQKIGLHGIAPYVGKMRPELVRELVLTHTTEGDIVFDPFSGSGTTLLESWFCNRMSFGTDLNYYAFFLASAKLHPYNSLSVAIQILNEYNNQVVKLLPTFTGKSVPVWVRSFFHPDTLKEIQLWVDLLQKNNDIFILANLMGILHHQRPGFLSYPSSHGAPYLRNEKYPRTDYPEMYEYRNVFDRLEKKIIRTYCCFPQELDFNCVRNMYHQDAIDFDTHNINRTSNQQLIIISSPPYMKALTYARDNRLRLWFLGIEDWQSLDKIISTGKNQFEVLMKGSFQKWQTLQHVGDKCILVVGDMIFDRKTKATIPDMLTEIASRNGYILRNMIDDPINYDRKTVKRESSIKSEKICVFERV